MTTQIQPHKLNTFGSISIIGFQKIFLLVCDTNGLHKGGAAMWVFNFLMKKTPFAVLNARFGVDRTGKNTAVWLVINKNSLPPTHR